MLCDFGWTVLSFVTLDDADHAISVLRLSTAYLRRGISAAQRRMVSSCYLDINLLSRTCDPWLSISGDLLGIAIRDRIDSRHAARLHAQQSHLHLEYRYHDYQHHTYQRPSHMPAPFRLRTLSKLFLRYQKLPSVATMLFCGPPARRGSVVILI